MAWHGMGCLRVVCGVSCSIRLQGVVQLSPASPCCTGCWSHEFRSQTRHLRPRLRLQRCSSWRSCSTVARRSLRELKCLSSSLLPGGVMIGLIYNLHWAAREILLANSFNLFRLFLRISVDLPMDQNRQARLRFVCRVVEWSGIDRCSVMCHGVRRIKGSTVERFGQSPIMSVQTLQRQRWKPKLQQIKSAARLSPTEPEQEQEQGFLIRVHFWSLRPKRNDVVSVLPVWADPKATRSHTIRRVIARPTSAQPL